MPSWTSRAARLLPSCLLVFLGVAWAVEVYMDLKTGRFALPVTVAVDGIDPGAAAQICAYRISPNGNEWEETRVPGVAEWTGRRAYYRHLRLSVPPKVAAQITGGRVRLGPRLFSFDLRTLNAEWRQSGSDGPSDGTVVFQTPDNLKAASSRFPRMNDLMNWPGDAAFLKRLLIRREAYRVLVALVLIALLRFYDRASQPRRELLERHVPFAMLGLVLAYVLGCLVPVFVSRIAFPLSIEHLEGVQATCTWLWRDGADLYASPSIESCANIYTPGYYVAARAWAALFGLTLPSLRALTWLCLAGTAVCAAYVARRLEGTWRAGLMWTPLYLLPFTFYGWVDNANKDPLHTFLALAGFAFLAAALSPTSVHCRLHCLACGLLWACAFMTKQSHAVVVAPVLLAMLIWARPQALYVGASVAFATGGMTLLALGVWGVRYWDWTVVIPRGHGVIPSQFITCVSGLTAHAIGLVVLAAIYWFPAARRRAAGDHVNGPEPQPVVLRYILGAFVFGCFLMGSLSAAKARGGAYAFMPAMAALCIPASAAFVSSRRSRAVCAFVLLLLATIPPFHGRVTPRDRAAAQHLIDVVREEPGEVWVPYHSWVNVAAGKRPYVPLFCIGEWMSSGRAFPESVLEAIDTHRFALIVTDFNLPEYPQAASDSEPYVTLREHYEARGVVPVDKAYVVKDGWTNIPRVLWRPKTGQARHGSD